MAIAAAAAAVSSPNLYYRPGNPRLPHQQETAATATLIVKPKSAIFGRRALSFLYDSQRNDGGRIGGLPIRSEMTTESATSDDPGFAERGAGLYHIPRISPLMAASPAVASSVALPPKRYKKSVCLFYCEEMRELAERVALESDSIYLRSISWRCALSLFFACGRIEMSTWRWRKFRFNPQDALIVNQLKFFSSAFLLLEINLFPG